MKEFNNTNLNGLNGQISVRVEFSTRNKTKKELFLYYDINKEKENSYDDREKLKYNIPNSENDKEIKVCKNDHEEGKVNKIVIRKRLGEKKIGLKRERSRDSAEKEKIKLNDKTHTYSFYEKNRNEKHKRISRETYSSENSKDRSILNDSYKKTEYMEEIYKISKFSYSFFL